MAEGGSQGHACSSRCVPGRRWLARPLRGPPSRLGPRPGGGARREATSTTGPLGTLPASTVGVGRGGQGRGRGRVRGLAGGRASRRGRGGRGTPLRSASLRVAGLRAPPPSPRPGGGGRGAYLGRLADLEQVQPVGVPMVNDVGQLPPLLVAATRRHGRGRFSSSSSSCSRAAGPEHRRPPHPPQPPPRPPPPLPPPPARPPPGSARVRPAPPPSTRLSRGRCAERRAPPPTPRPPPCAPAVRVPVRTAHLGAAPLGAAAWPRARGWGWGSGARRESARSAPCAGVPSPRDRGVPDRSGWVPTGANGFYERAGSALSRLRCGGLTGGAAS